MASDKQSSPVPLDKETICEAVKYAGWVAILSGPEGGQTHLAWTQILRGTPGTKRAVVLMPSARPALGYPGLVVADATNSKRNAHSPPIRLWLALYTVCFYKTALSRLQLRARLIGSVSWVSNIFPLG